MENSEDIDGNGNIRQLSDQLEDAALFRGLETDERETLLRIMVVNKFSADDVIVRQEIITRDIWMLMEGECEVIKQPPIGELGSPVLLAQLHPFDVFGEMTVISSEPHVASVEAKSDVQTLRLRGADFDQLIDSNPRLACRLACNLVRILSERLRCVDEKLSRSLDGHEELKTHQAWQELRGRLGKLYAGSPM